MNIDFFAIFKAIKLSSEQNSFMSDFDDILSCTCCDSTIDQQCESNCHFSVAKEVSSNFENADYDRVVSLALDILEGLSYHSVNHHTHYDYCSFCDRTYGEHDNDCPTTVIQQAFDSVQYDRNAVEKVLKTKTMKALFEVSATAYMSVERHKESVQAQLLKEEKERKARARINATCRACGKVLKSKGGRIEHENSVEKCKSHILKLESETLA